MLKEVRKIYKTDVSKSKYIRYLMHTGRINAYVNEKGYACYDTEELKKYYNSVKLGRPIKIKK